MAPQGIIRKEPATAKIKLQRTKSPVTVKKTTSSFPATPRSRTNTVPKVGPKTPIAKDKKAAPAPGSAIKSIKKRRPKPAHSGVPVPEKLRKLIEKEQQNPDCSL